MNVNINGRTLSLIQGDITLQSTDAIVNSANPSLLGMGGVSGAILRGGGAAVLRECREIIQRQGSLSTGKAVITSGGNLKAKYVIHTVGPVWYGGNKNKAELLASAYEESLRLTEKYDLHSISFPSISTGIFGYPVNQAAKIAMKTVVDFLKYEARSVEEVVFVLYDVRTLEAYQAVLIDIGY